MDSPPEKISREEKVNQSVMKQIEYDNTPPVDENGTLTDYDDSAHDLNSTREKKRTENRKKNNK